MSMKSNVIKFKGISDKRGEPSLPRERDSGDRGATENGNGGSTGVFLTQDGEGEYGVIDAAMDEEFGESELTVPAGLLEPSFALGDASRSDFLHQCFSYSHFTSTITC